MDRETQKNRRGRLRSWLQLFRVPNLLTVPGDPIVGFFLAAQSPAESWTPLGLVAGAALCFYAAGLAWNDYFDVFEDRYARKARPLATGQIRPWAALAAACVLTVAGLSLCAYVGTTTFWVGLVLAACVFGYNRYLKSVPGVGMLAMGACRGLSVLLGASVVPILHPFTAPVWIAAAVMFFYVAAVTQLARREVEPHHPGAEVWMPFTVLLLGALFLSPHLADETSARIGFFAAYAAAFVLSLAFAFRMRGFASTPNLPLALERRDAIPAALPGWIGWLISGLLFLQAAFIFSAGCGQVGTMVAATLIACWVLNRLLARFFYAS